MDNARFLLAIVLAIAVIVVTNLLFPTRRPAPVASPADTAAIQAPAPASPGSTATTATTATAQPESAVASLPVPRPPSDGSTAAVVRADTVTAASPIYDYGISAAGGSIVRARLLRYESFTRPGPVDLVPAAAPDLVDYGLQIGDQVLDLRTLAFDHDARSFELDAAEAPRTVHFVHTDAERGLEIRIDYTFRPDDYLLDVNGQVSGLGDDPGTLLLRMGPRLSVNEADTLEDIHSLAYVVDARRAGITSVPFRKVEGRQIQEGPLYWAALKNKYFLGALIAECGDEGGTCFGGTIAEPVVGNGAPAGVRITTTLPLSRSGTFAYSIYLGPQEYNRLAAIGHDLQDVNPWGFKVFRPILRPLSHLIVWTISALHDVLHLGYGWVLIVFGFLLQVVLWPLYARATRSQLKNMELQPVMQEIQKKYKDDQEKLQKEMMRLYKEEGFNPLGGCLPMLIPYPVLITLFFVFRSTIEFRGVDFLWLPDLSRPDPLFILPIILALSMFVLQYLSYRSTPTANAQMKVMMWVMPAFIAFFFFKLPAGLNLYYAASNIASVPRQVQIMRERKRVQQKQKPG